MFELKYQTITKNLSSRNEYGVSNKIYILWAFQLYTVEVKIVSSVSHYEKSHFLKWIKFVYREKSENAEEHETKYEI